MSAKPGEGLSRFLSRPGRGPSGPAIEGAVIAEFPTMEAAKACFTARHIRRRHSIASVVPHTGASSSRGFEHHLAERRR
jgi:hypothetical protein